MKMGILRAPGDLRMRVNWVMVCCRICGGQMSIFVMTTITGTFRARAMPRCSLGWVLEGREGCISEVEGLTCSCRLSRY